MSGAAMARDVSRIPADDAGRRPDLCQRPRPRHPPQRKARQRLQLPRRRRQAGDRRGDARPHPQAGHPAGLDRRLDLPRRRAATSRPPAATRGPQAVPLPPALARRCATRRKYDRMIAFGQRAAAAARAGRRTTCARRGLPREKVLAAVVAAAGDDPDPRRQRRVRPAEQVLRPDHAARPARRRRAARRVRFEFRGKSGKRARRSSFSDRRLARIVQRCQDLPGQRAVPVPRRRRRAPAPSSSADVNDYLREIAGRGLHRQGLPHLGRHAWRPPGRSTPARPAPTSAQAKRERRHLREGGGRRARQHARRLPHLLHPSRGDRRLRRRSAEERLLPVPGKTGDLRARHAAFPRSVEAS